MRLKTFGAIAAAVLVTAAAVYALSELGTWHSERLKIQAETELSNETEWHNQRAREHIAQFPDFEDTAKKQD